MRFFRFITIIMASVLMAACSNSSVSQKLDSFVDNAELNSSGYDAEDWQKSMSQYEKLVEEYSNSGGECSEAEKQMAARAMGRYHSLLIKNGVKQSAAYLKELGSVLTPYLEGLADGFGEDSGEFGKGLEEFINSLELEKAFEELGKALEDIFEGTDEEQ